MKSSHQRTVHPAASALAILLVLAGVQWVWWRFLVYRAPVSGAGQPPPPMMQGPPPSVTVLGRADVIVTTFAGAEKPGDADGPGYRALFDRPTGLAVSRQGDLYVADTGNNRIRLIHTDGVASTVAGADAGWADGTSAQARFNAPCGVAVAPNGDVYVADTGNHRVRRITSDGMVTTPAGGESGFAGGAAADARFNSPCSVAVDQAGAVLIADTGNGSVRRLIDGRVTTLFGRPGTGGAKVDNTRPSAFFVSVCATPAVVAAAPGSGIVSIGGRTLQPVPIHTDSTLTPAQAAALRLNHPVGLCAFADGWLMTDDEHGAVFLVRNGSAEVIAGRCNTSGMQSGSTDGSGANALFGRLGGIATDGKRYAYVADTSNNTIRRLDISELVRR
jgi:sugar lactone lactonase YvrE